MPGKKNLQADLNYTKYMHINYASEQVCVLFLAMKNLLLR